MEGIFFILIGAALYSQSWYILGMYSEGRAMAIFVGGLGLLSLATLTFAPTLLTGEPRASDFLTEMTLMKSLIVLWAVYAVGVASHGLWDFDERAIGFYGGFLSVATLVSFLYFALNLQGPDRYSDAAWLALSGGALLLTILASVVFFFRAFAFDGLRLLAGWLLLLGGGAVAAIGLAITSAAIS